MSKKRGDVITQALLACPAANLSLAGEQIHSCKGYNGENWSIVVLCTMIRDHGWKNLTTYELVTAILATGIHQPQDPTNDL